MDFSDENGIHEESNLIQSSCDFFFNFWFIIQTLFEPENFDSKFVNHLDDLKELFLRYDYFLNNSVNSLLSYLASCSFFTSLFTMLDEVQLNDQSKLLLTRFRENFSSDMVIAIHRRAFQLQFQTDELKERLLDLQKFNLFLHDTSINIQ